MARRNGENWEWGGRRRKGRRGSAALDYFLVLCVILPMVIFTMRVAPRIMNLVYEMVLVMISWPLL